MSWQQPQQQQLAGGQRPMSYADGSYNAHPVGANPERQQPHSRSKSLLSSFRSNNSAPKPGPQTYNGRPSISSLNSVPEDGVMAHQQQVGQQPQGQPSRQPQRQGSLKQIEPMQAQQLHPEIRSVVSLVTAHAHKVYFSGPLIERKERLTDGSRNHKDEIWLDVWAQLGGTTLSIWDMRAIEEASKEGREVPPTYINIQDAFVQVVGSVTVPPTDGHPSKRYTDVLTLNTAGSNLFLFSCPDTASLVSWASALRLAAWEKSRLEEIYTAHLLRMSLSENGQWKDPRPTLVKGRLEGWAKVRVAGQVDWKRLWMVVSAGYTGDANRPSSPTPPSKKNRVSALFNRSSSPTPSTAESLRPNVAFFAGPKGKERKMQVISMGAVSQAFAVYPERPEMIPHSTLLKLEGVLGSEDYAMGMKGREGWLLIMPEAESEKIGALEMLKWLVAMHDAFQLYGRPAAYTWDPREPQSMMFAYPVGPLRDHLFLDRELAEGLDPRDDRTSFIRSQLLGVQVRRMRGLPVQVGQLAQNVQNLTQGQSGPGTSTPTSPSTGAPMLPPIGGIPDQQQQTPPLSPPPQDPRNMPQLPPLSFDQAKAKPTPPTPVSPVRASDIPGARSPSPVPAPAPTTTSAAFAQQQPKSPTPVSPSSLHPPPSAAGLPRPASPGTTSARAFQMAPRAPTPTGTRGQLVASPTSSVGSYGRPSIDGLPQQSEAIATPARLPQPPPMGAGPETVPPPAPPMSPASRPLPTSMPTSPMPNSPYGGQSQPQPTRQNTNLTQYTESSSNYDSVSQAQSSATQTSTQTQQQQPQSDYFFDEANAALYYMQTHPQQAPQQPTQQQLRDEETEAESTDGSQRKAMEFGRMSSAESGLSAKRSGSLARKPSGARALPPPRRLAGAGGAEKTRSELATVEASPPAHVTQHSHAQQPTNAMGDDAADALAALSFLEREEQTQHQPQIRPLVVNKSPPPPSPSSATPPPLSAASASSQYPSSFAQSRGAQERKAQQAARQAASQQPGRPNGRNGAPRTGRTGWQSSDEEEEEEEEEDDDDDADSDGPPRSAVLPPRMQEDYAQQQRERSPMPSDGRSRQLQDNYNQSLQRPPRVLPQIPAGRSPSGSMQGHQTPPRGYEDASPSRPTTQYQYEEDPRASQAHLRGQSSQQALPPSRQTVWSTVLDPSVPQPLNAPHGRETFVQLEPSETMTKAFTPQGLLQAGLQDKQERSAKKQEEMARETGASLINVPSKPPPPQTGLLGAITAHERDRKREGGVGAALTEREREKRLAEERQRKIDELSRNQLEQLGNGGGSVYNMQGGSPQGYPGYPMMNPMFMNPMMSMYGFPGMMPGMPGMPPMGSPMAGGMGSPMGQMPGMSGFQQQQQQMAQQQQLWAAQAAAADAYQRTMMSFSAAGSQAGDAPEGSQLPGSQVPGAPQGQGSQLQPQQWNPMMMGGMNMGMNMMHPMMGMMPGMMSSPGSEYGGGGGGMMMPPPRPTSGHISQQGSPRQSPMRRTLDESPARGNSPAR
ncbi:hypothetical protein EXIGLDRAFT_678466 [Exidia glandulosa HHB12029]|uniref:PH domain-containing protein n=1 Tax=Exidia glandulosa HHB12029 TaxID=1314781 RepID=A0A165FF42_EXIGL|nr:hypothetical protein EXIGLDRAFT_678466 [Exidia glandulosa HHB12029]